MWTDFTINMDTKHNNDMENDVKYLQEKLAAQELWIDSLLKENTELMRKVSALYEQLALGNVKAKLNDNGFWEYVKKDIIN